MCHVRFADVRCDIRLPCTQISIQAAKLYTDTYAEPIFKETCFGYQIFASLVRDSLSDKESRILAKMLHKLLPCA